MKTENTKPLYKVLNEQRTQGKVSFYSKYKGENACALDIEDTTIAEVVGHYNNGEFKISREQAQANAQYTALAVNNLAALSEALEEALYGLEIANKDNPNKGFKSSIAKAKEALSRIS